MAWPVVVRIVGGGSVCDVVESEVAADRLQGFEQLFLAVEAAIRVVALVRLELDLVGGDVDQPRSQVSGQDARLLLLRLGVRGRARQHRDRAVAELVQRQLQQQRGITPPEYATRTE